MMNKITQKLKGQISLLFIICSLSFSVSACSDFFDQESEHVLYADQEHLDNAVDTIYSVTGILKKLQTIADRTQVLGEVRADLVDLTNSASADLREVATFSIDDDNVYNQPRDYYAIINNCNYFLTHVDTALRNNRNQLIFMKEYAAVKAIRAWTYLQLVLNYGKVPFVVEPILTKEQAERSYTNVDLQYICDYFINDLADIPEEYNRSYPGYRNIGGHDSRLFWFPLSIIRGELNLWGGHYKEAAVNYYKYISERNGQESSYPTGAGFYSWMPGSTTWNSVFLNDWSTMVSTAYSTNGELITMIPDDSSDSIRSEGFYSELTNLYTTSSENDYKVSLTPSARMVEISESQSFCCLNSNGSGVYYAPSDLANHQSGDLRLSNTWREYNTINTYTNERIDAQVIYKHANYGTGVHIYRRQMIYLRLAEALNQAGYPRMAFMILSTGLSDKVMAAEVMPYYNNVSDSTFLAQFKFPNNRYAVVDEEDIVQLRVLSEHNMIGIHSRGSGWTPMNEYYQFNDSVMVDSVNVAVPLVEQQAYVDSLLLNEGALELCFEGTRFYDLMRAALRQPNPGQFMAKQVCARRGEKNSAAMQGQLGALLLNKDNWYLKWNGKIGIDIE